jgi:hypothetical protein
MAECANEALVGFRSYLPDCRGYEMVTPVFKDGTRPSLRGVSSDGSRLIAQALGTFGGAEAGSSAQGAFYEFSRSGSGWSTSAISPPASEFPAQELLAASPDLQRTLWLMRTGEQSIYAKDLYMREADGTLLKIGSLVPPSAEVGEPAGGSQEFFNPGSVAYADASADLSHVVFIIRTDGPLWPGDTTANLGTNQSLYEYALGGPGKPELVGVNAAGHLISNCATYLGSAGSGDVYNAASADGAVAFFTAAGHNGGKCSGIEAPAVNELFARFDGVETVAVSEPSAGSCASCLTPATEGEGRRKAEFAGASEDGSRVFFLTEQELLAGAKGMNLYEFDFDSPAGARVSRVSTGTSTPEVQGVARVSEDGSHVYFVAKGVLTGSQTNTFGNAAQAGEDNLYVFEHDAANPAGKVTFIATLSSEDSEDWGEVGGNTNQDERPVQATPDGRFLVFDSAADLTPGDTSTVPQVFEYDAATGELVRVSRERAGYTPPTELSANERFSSILAPRYIEHVTPAQAVSELAITSDGSTVLFKTRAALTEEAEAAAEEDAKSVYEYHSTVAAGGTIADGDVYLISDGKNPLDVEEDELDSTGEDVFFETADSLVPQDTDTQYDFYDARVGGGYPAGDPSGCGGGCGSPSLLQQDFATPGSASVTGTGALAPATTGSAAADSGKPRPATSSRAGELANALKACGRERPHKRAACAASARRRYHTTTKTRRTRTTQ